MGRFIALVRAAFLQLMAGLRAPSRNKGRATKGYGAIAFFCFLALYLSAVYSIMFSELLKRDSQDARLLIFMMSVISLVMGVMMTAFSAGGMLFGGRDADMLLSLPVSAFEIMLSKTLALYIENLFFAVFFMAPAGIVYAVNAPGTSALFFIMLLLATPFLALLSTTLSFLIGFLLTWSTSRLGGSKLLSNLLYLVFFGAVIAASFSVNRIATGFVASAQGLAGGGGPLWPLALFSRAVFGDIGALALFALLACALFLLVVLLFSRGYKRLINSVCGVKTRGDYRLGAVRSGSQTSALLRKEADKYFGTPLYLFNTGFGLILLLGGSVYALIKRAEIPGLLSSMGMGSSSGMTAALAAACVCFCVSTSSTTSVSISLERDRLWILKESPLAASTVFGAKVLFNILLDVPAAVIAAALLGAACSLGAVDVLLTAALGSAVAILVSYAGLIVNLAYPRLDALNDTVIIKQSLSAMIAIFGAMLLTGAVAALYITVLSAHISFRAFALICTALALAAASLCARLLAGWGARRFAQL